MKTANNSQMMGERKLVTVLFADISGFTAMSEKLDPELVRDRINTCFARLVPVIKKHSGVIDKFIGDEIMAIFGAPVVHEDDAELAAFSALEMMDTLQVYNREFGTNLGMHIGINSGAVIAGGIGSPDELQYGVLGDTVNLASRLADAAERGQIFLGERTSRLIAPVFYLDALEPIRVKGKSDPVAVFLLKGVKERPGRLRGLEGYGLVSPMVGRHSEIALITSCINRLFTGQGGVVGIIGEAGLGKTRLVAEALMGIKPQAWNGEARSPLILEGATLSYGQTISFWPFQEILRQYFGITQQDTGSTAWEKMLSQIIALFPGEIGEFLPYLGSLMAFEVPAEWRKPLQYLDSDSMRKQIFKAVRRLFEVLSKEHPLILVFEDLHWMDETSIRLLEYLLPMVENHPILIIGLSRPYTNTPPAQLQAVIFNKYSQNYQEIRLSPLLPAESDQLVRNLLRLKEVPGRLRANIVDKAEGNPFFLEEVIHTLIEAKAVARDPSTNSWSVTEDIGKIAISDNIQGVIMARIDRMDEEFKHVLRLASVIGRSFLYIVLKAIETQASELDKELAELQQVELVLIKRQAPELEYIFKHALVQEATYESILLQQRRELHFRVGKAVEELFADRLEEFYGLLAYHYARAEAWEKAQFYLLKAGDEAGRLAADAEALTYYRQAAEAYQRVFGDHWDPLQRAALERKIGEALWRRGEHLQALEHLELGLSFLGKSIPKNHSAIYLGILKAAVIQLGHRLLPGLFLPGPGTEPNSAAMEEVLIYETITWIEAFSNHERFLLGCLRELNTAEKSGFDLGIVLSATGVGTTAVYIPIYPLAKIYFTLGAQRAEIVSNPIASGMIQYGLAIYQVEIGNFEQAAMHAEKSLIAYQQAGDLHGVILAKGAIVMAMLYQGNLLKFRGLAKEVVDLSRDANDLVGLVMGLSIEAYASIIAGDNLEQTITVLENELEVSKTILFQMGVVLLFTELGRCYTQKGEPLRALDILRKGQELAREYEVTIPHLVSELYLGIAEAYLAAAEQAQGSEKRAWMKQASHACQKAIISGRNFRGGIPEALRLQGCLEWLRGNPEKSRQRWLSSLSKAEQLGMQYQASMARLELGKRSGDEEQLKKAELELKNLGIQLL